MKRSINRWTMSLATAGLLALPVTSFAKASQEQAPPQQQQPQQPQPAQPQPERPQQPPTDPQPQPTPQPQPQPAQPQPTQPQPTEPQTPRPTTSAAQSPSDQSSPQEHLRQAQDAVKAISGDAVPAKNRSDFAKLKQHLSNLEKMGSSPSASTAEPASPGAGKSASAPKANWGTEVAAIDKIISEIVGSETASPATSTPGATGTSGAAKSSAAIDDATRAKLMEVRTHITAYAAAMAGAPSTPKSEEPASTAAPTAAAAPSSTASPTAASASTPSSQPPAATPSAQSPAAGAQNSPATQPDPNAPAQPPAAGQQPAAAGAQTPANADEAHRHLVAARDTLSQLTQLPAAAQLNGEARTQVSQLISNFNELIGNPPDWRASYQKVAANMTALLGPENSDAEAQGGAPTAAAGATPAPGATPTPTPSATPGAVGTAGTASVELDPSIRAKLVEFRRSLTQFEKAAGGTK